MAAWNLIRITCLAFEKWFAFICGVGEQESIICRCAAWMLLWELYASNRSKWKNWKYSRFAQHSLISLTGRLLLLLFCTVCMPRIRMSSLSTLLLLHEPFGQKQTYFRKNQKEKKQKYFQSDYSTLFVCGVRPLQLIHSSGREIKIEQKRTEKSASNSNPLGHCNSTNVPFSAHK